VVRQMTASGLVETAQNETLLIQGIVEAGLPRFDAIQRELCWHLLQSFEATLGRELTTTVARSVAWYGNQNSKSSTPLKDVQLKALANTIDNQDQLRLAQQLDANSLHIVVRELHRKFAESYSPSARTPNVIEKLSAAAEAQILSELQSLAARSWSNFVRSENQLLYRRSGTTWTNIVVDELCTRQAIVDSDFERTREQIVSARYGTMRRNAQHDSVQHTGMNSRLLIRMRLTTASSANCQISSIETCGSGHIIMHR